MSLVATAATALQTPPASALSGGLGAGLHDPLVVTLSVVVAMLATFATLDLLHSHASADRQTRRIWVVGAGTILGVGIWSMHLLGSLAFSLPRGQVVHHLPLLVAALFAAVASGLGGVLLLRGTDDRRRLAGGWLVLAAGLLGVHLLGTRGMRMPARIEWDAGMLTGAVVMGLVTTGALAWRIRRELRDGVGGRIWVRMMAGVVLGTALAGVHFLWIGAATFVPFGRPVPLRSMELPASDGLALAVMGATLLVLVVAVAGSTVERALARRQRAAEENGRLYAEAERARTEAEARSHELERTTTVLQALVRSAPLAIVGMDREGVVELWNPAAERLFGWSSEEITGEKLPLAPLPEEGVRDGGAGEDEEDLELPEAVLSGKSISGVETRRVTKSGETVVVAVSASPLLGDGGKIRGAIAMFSDASERKRAEEERARLLERERSARVEAEQSTGKREALADLGQRALAGADPEVLMHEAVRVVASQLAVELVEVLALSEDGEHFLLRAGTGWNRGLVGELTVTAGKESHAGYTLRSRGPVVVEDLAEEERFGRTGHLEDHGVVTGVTAIVEGRGGPWGVLGVYSTERRIFSGDDIAFVQALANVLAQAVERSRADEERGLLLDRERSARGEAERRAREESALRQAAEAVTASFTIDEVIHEIAQGALTATAADGAFVERMDGSLREVEVVAVAGESTPHVGSRSPYEGSLAQRVVEREEPLVLKASELEEAGAAPELEGSCRGCSLLAIPLVNGSSPIGALVLLRQAERAAFRPDEVDRAHTFGELAALAFRKVHLLHESERRREELERVTESRSRLMRGFSHDVKNPLGAADGYLELLEEGILDGGSPESQETIRRVRRAIRSALDLINDLISLARAESGEIELQIRPTDLREVCREMAEEHRAISEAKGLGLDLDLPERVPLIRSDPARVRQVLGNLISNAVKYTDEGRIQVSLDMPEESPGGSGRPGEAGSQAGRRTGEGPRGRWLATHVRDTGPGIPREKQSLLFREFSRLEEDKEGVGLGLAISKRIVEALGGRITVRSEPGRGSEFTLWLPLTPEMEDSGGSGAQAGGGGQEPRGDARRSREAAGTG